LPGPGVPGYGVVTTKKEMAKFRESTIALHHRPHEIVVQHQTRDEIVKTMQNEFHWVQLHLSLDGAPRPNCGE